MTVITPPLFQTVDGVYQGRHLGIPYRDILSEGVVGSTALAVSERGAGANMSVDVAAGVAWIAGDDNTATQPLYRAYNDGTVNLAVTAADATNPRIDRVIAEVRDSAFSGVSQDWRLRVVAGTPAGSPSAPALPSNAISLATISVPASDTTISDAQITDTRPFAMVGAGAAAPLYVTSLPANPYDGQEVYYGAAPSSGVIWHLRYRSAASGSYKWEYIGGPPMYAEIDTAESRNNGTFGALATAGPSVTVPLAGDYIVDLGSQMAGAGVFGMMSYDIGGTGAVDADGVQTSISTETQDNYVYRSNVKTALAASTALVAKYRTSGSVTFTRRIMLVRPIRVG